VFHLFSLILLAKLRQAFSLLSIFSLNLALINIFKVFLASFYFFAYVFVEAI
jgi:hypothetical protein